MFHFALPDGSGFDLAYPGSGPIAAFDAAGNIVAICIGVEKRLCKFLREVKKAQDVNKFKDEAQEWVERIEAKNKPWSVHEFLVEESCEEDEPPATLDELVESIQDYWGNPSTWDAWHVVKKMNEGQELSCQYLLAGAWNVLESTQHFIESLDNPIGGKS